MQITPQTSEAVSFVAMTICLIVSLAIFVDQVRTYTTLLG